MDKNSTPFEDIECAATSFAAIRADGEIVTWGEPEAGGDCSKVQHRLRRVQKLKGTAAAFAAVLEDGHLVTWGLDEYGGDCSGVVDQLGRL